MFLTVVLLAVVNLGLGFGLALLLERPIPVPTFLQARLPAWNWKRTSRRVPPRPAVPQPEPIVEAPTESPPPPRRRNDFPWLFAEWGELLDRNAITVTSFPEALLWVAHLKMEEFCDRLQQCELISRSRPGDFPLPEMQAICENLKSQVADWNTAVQVSGSGATSPNEGQSPEQMAPWLMELVQQSHTIDQTCRQAESDAAQGVDRAILRRHLIQVFSQCRAALDRCNDSLAQRLRTNQRLDEIPARLQPQPGSRELTRLGLAYTVVDWKRKDPDHVRMASAVLVDLDQCAQLNEQFGIATTTELLAAVHTVLVDIVRKDRGFDRVAQLSGSAYLVFLGDTALRNATAGAERVRQSFAAAQFKILGQVVPLTTSCAVAEWNPEETFDQLVERLRVGITEAKLGGRNCTVVCGAEEMRVAQATPLQVVPREVKIG